MRNRNYEKCGIELTKSEIEGYNDTINKLEPIKELFEYISKEEEERKNPILYKTYKWLRKVKNKKK